MDCKVESPWGLNCSHGIRTAVWTCLAHLRHFLRFFMAGVKNLSSMAKRNLAKCLFSKCCCVCRIVLRLWRRERTILAADSFFSSWGHCSMVNSCSSAWGHTWKGKIEDCKAFKHFKNCVSVVLSSVCCGARVSHSPQRAGLRGVFRLLKVVQIMVIHRTAPRLWLPILIRSLRFFLPHSISSKNYSIFAPRFFDAAGRGFLWFKFTKTEVHPLFFHIWILLIIWKRKCHFSIFPKDDLGKL